MIDRTGLMHPFRCPAQLFTLLFWLGVYPMSAVVVVPYSRGAPAHALDDPASPIAVNFDDTDARLTVILKKIHSTWTQGTEQSGGTLKVATITQSSLTHLTAEAFTNDGIPLTLSFDLHAAAGELEIVIGGHLAANVKQGIQYPYAFFPSDGSGYAVIPLLGGYLVPTTDIDWHAPWSHSRMEWFGGTDAKKESGWLYIAEPAADMELVGAQCIVAGQPHIGGSFRWIGSNANSRAQPNLLSYERRSVLRFFADGGYVAQAKYFRNYASHKGWLRSLRNKELDNPEIGRLIGAPVIYLWGDGRSTELLDALKVAGVAKALIQISINHVDPSGAFPNEEYQNCDCWSREVRDRGYIPGIYDIYEAVRPARNVPQRQDGRQYSGFTYLWPANARHWNYVDASGSEGLRPAISPEMSAKFALDVRLPALTKKFNFDAFFLDTVCAVEPREDYGGKYGHTATRGEDILNRIALLQASSRRFNKITGTEQLKSWAVPDVDWSEGQFKLGDSKARGQYGRWNNDVYPEVTTDVVDPGDQLKLVLNPGYQIPLWELVYHDDVVSVQHWHLAHNKLLYCWDFADQMALLRGQSPLLNLVYAGVPGRSGRNIMGARDKNTGIDWDTRWRNRWVAEHVVKTYKTVCTWEEQVARMEMIDHKILRDDFSVQQSEFSDDGGFTGKGIVVNLGTFDGTSRMVGSPWVGKIRGQNLELPVKGVAEYKW